MKRKINAKKICMTGCLAVLGIFLFMIVLQVFTRFVLIRRLGMDNGFTRTVFAGNQWLYDDEMERREKTGRAEDDGEIEIDWEAYYPFSEESAKVKDPAFARYEGLVDSVEEKVQNNTDVNLLYYDKIVGYSKKYTDLLGWDLVTYNETNGVKELSDGHWTDFHEKVDTREHAEAVIRLDRYCKDKDIRFLYIQAPHKICKYEDKEISGTFDHTNQNADDLLRSLSDAGVSTYDLRDELHEEGLDHHELFFKTDHHWLPTTGLWAAGKIMYHLNGAYGWHMDTSLTDIENFRVVNYPGLFLGSHGRKATLERAEPEDIALLYPRYATDLHYTIPSKEIDQRGDLSITYDMSQMEKGDYYHKSAYTAYGHGDRPLINIENLEEVEDKKILLVKDSFSDHMASFLALGVRQMDVIDLRHFTGSLETYIRMTEPDVVLLMYTPSQIGEEIDLSGHRDLFDFR